MPIKICFGLHPVEHFVSVSALRATGLLLRSVTGDVIINHSWEKGWAPPLIVSLALCLITIEMNDEAHKAFEKAKEGKEWVDPNLLVHFCLGFKFRLDLLTQRTGFDLILTPMFRPNVKNNVGIVQLSKTVLVK